MGVVLVLVVRGESREGVKRVCAQGGRAFLGSVVGWRSREVMRDDEVVMVVVVMLGVVGVGWWVVGRGGDGSGPWCE